MVSKKRTYKKKKPASRKKKSAIKIRGVIVDVGKEANFKQRGPLPLKFKTKHTYAETVSFATGAGGVLGTEQQWRLNNLFDVNQTGVGLQPYGYDQITPFYSKYHVTDAKFSLIWSSIGGTADIMTAYKLQTGSNALTLTGVTCDTATMMPNVTTGLLSASGRNRVLEQNGKVPLHKLFGLTKRQYDDQSYWAQSTSSATEPAAGYQAAIHVSVGSMSGVAAEACTCQFVCEYTVEWTSIIDQAPS